MTINKELIKKLYDEAVVNPRLRQSYNLRTEATDPELGHTDNSQRILNALMPGTVVPIHRHPNSNETCLCLSGKLVHVFYTREPNGEMVETERHHLDPPLGNFGVIVPAGVWHTVEVLEPSVIYEAKDGRYGQDWSETF